MVDGSLHQSGHEGVGAARRQARPLQLRSAVLDYLSPYEKNRS